MTKKTSFLRLSATLEAAGIECHDAAAFCGSFCDGSGIEPGKEFSVLRVSIDWNLTPDALEKVRFLHQVERRYKKLHFEIRSTYDYVTAVIWTDQDYKESRRLEERKDVFLNAFWQCRHENRHASQAEMISAGNAALIAAYGG